MKRFISILMAILMIAALCACGSEDKTETPAPAQADVNAEPAQEAPEADAPAAPEQESSAPAVFKPVGMDIGDYYVEVIGAEYFADSDDKDAVRFYYDFTNRSDDAISAWFALNYAAEEDGYELVSTYAYYEDDVPEYGNDSLKVQPGVTIRCVAEFSFRPDGSELTFHAYDYDDNELVCVFDPQNLPGRPGDWSIEPITDPQNYLDYPAEGENECAYVAITGVEIVPGDPWFGYDEVIRAYFDYTNYEDEESYIDYTTNIIAFQDGVELDYGIAEDSLDSDDVWGNDVPAGESCSVSRCWALRSDSPVEIVVIDWRWPGDVICASTFYPD